MRVSCEWLQEWLGFTVTVNFAVSAFTKLGFEVEEVDGEVLDLAIPPNRGDCFSIRGLARELAVFKGNKDLLQDKITLENLSKQKQNLLVHNKCNVYCGEILFLDKKVKDLITPSIILKRLQAANIKDINFIVNLTNYIMLEIGQPMHAFDNRILTGQITVRTAFSEEQLELLNGNVVNLTAQDLVIADEQKTLALAGIMGGNLSGISDDTQEIFVESANFDPETIMLSMRRHLNAQVQTDSALRFARGVDLRLASAALFKFKQILSQYVKFQVKNTFFAQHKYHKVEDNTIIKLPLVKVSALLGITINHIEIKNILYNLHLNYIEEQEDLLLVEVPQMRNDINIMEDLVEEIGRIYGYDNIEPQAPRLTMNFKKHAASWVNKNKVSDKLSSLGYTETISYSFIERELISEIYMDEYASLQIKNPITQENNFMRPSLFPGLLQQVAYNQARQMKRVKIFEIGKVFSPKLSDEKIHVAGVITATAYPEQWGLTARDVDLFDVKGDLENLFISNDIQFLDINNEHKLNDVWCAHSKFLMEGARAAMSIDNKRCGVFGVLDARWALKFKVAMPVVLFAFELSNIERHTSMQNINKYPSMRRDLAIVVPDNILVGNIIAAIKRWEKILLKNIVVFDIYRGKNIAKGYKSIGLGLIFGSEERTLIDADVNNTIDKIIIKLKEEFGITLRDV